MSLFKRLMGRLVPPSAEETSPAAAEQVAAAVDLQKTMGRDRVTGLPHRACFAYLLALQGQVSARLKTRLSVVVLDWPGYVDEPDSDARDRRLNRMAAGLRDALLRTDDVLGSLGDGRLAALLPFTDGAGADTVARNLQRAAQAALDGLPLPAPANIEGLDDAASRPAEEVAAPADEFTGAIINVGISSYNGKGVLADDALLKAAERAVAFAAMNGGDRVVRFDPGSDAAR